MGLFLDNLFDGIALAGIDFCNAVDSVLGNTDADLSFLEKKCEPEPRQLEKKKPKLESKEFDEIVNKYKEFGIQDAEYYVTLYLEAFPMISTKSIEEISRELNCSAHDIRKANLYMAMYEKEKRESISKIGKKMTPDEHFVYILTEKLGYEKNKAEQAIMLEKDIKLAQKNGLDDAMIIDLLNLDPSWVDIVVQMRNIYEFYTVTHPEEKLKMEQGI
ncbi:MAG: hypothetical protein ACI4F9_10245 [Lachnospiraceae bacterium]